jgi:hypothetical protein
MTYEYLHVARASDLKGRDRLIYRFLEILPGFLSWATIIGAVVFSWLTPIAMAIFIIVFDIYWLVKTAYLSVHLRTSWRKMQHNLGVDWRSRLTHIKYDEVWHLVLLPMYKESETVVIETMEKIVASDWPRERMIVVLATEEAAGEMVQETARVISAKYASRFGNFLTTVHPKDVLGEMAGKGSNIAYAAQEVKKLVVDAKNIPYENIIVSAFDIDTQVLPQYFLCLTYYFLTCEDPYHTSFQPIPVYNNNIWQAPALSRVVATSGTFWQMMQQERPERLATFSSHAISFKALHEIGYWQPNMVSEDSRIFWNAFLHYDGNYRVEPIFYPVSMDANFGRNFWETANNVYRQQRRWTWGVENLPYLFFGFIKNKKIAWRKKLHFIFVQVEGFWSLTTNPILIFFLGWLPLFLGGDAFNESVLSYNLPRVTRLLMIITMAGLFMSAVISTNLLPPRPAGVKGHKYAYMVLQWLLVPITIVFFGAIPGLDAQTRLMLGRYMGFWVTPKERRDSKTGGGSEER